MKNPLVYLFFNRPDCVKHTFPAVRRYRPDRLHLVCDGPRMGREDDVAATELSRKTVDEMIDWPCEVIRHFSETNLGCGLRISSALTEVFKTEDRAIILEDDCQAGADFFRFMDAGLDFYATDSQVMLLSGSPLLRRPAISNSNKARFTRYWSPWGWGTWSRFWTDYDFSLAGVEKWLSTDVLSKILSFPSERKRFSRYMISVKGGEIDTWDYQVYHTLWRLNGFCVEPPVNLIRNIGYSGTATHTIGFSDPRAFRNLGSLEPISFPTLPNPEEVLSSDRSIGRWVEEGPRLQEKLAALVRAVYWRTVLRLE